MLRFVLNGRLAQGVLRITCRGAVGSHLCVTRGGERSPVYSDQVFRVPRPARVFSTSSTPSLSDENRLVYVGNIRRLVFGAKLFSYSSSLVTICVFPLVFMKAGVGVEGLAAQVAVCSLVAFFTFINPFILYYITRGYVIRLYHNKDKDLYTAVTYNLLLSEKRTVFSPNEVVIPDNSKMFTTFYVKNKSMLVNPSLFPLRKDFAHLMGYDKPFNFSFDPEDLQPPKGQ